MMKIEVDEEDDEDEDDEEESSRSSLKREHSPSRSGITSCVAPAVEVFSFFTSSSSAVTVC